MLRIVATRWMPLRNGRSRSALRWRTTIRSARIVVATVAPSSAGQLVVDDRTRALGVVVHGSDLGVSEEPIYTVLTADAGLLMTRLEALGRLAERAVDVDLAHLQLPRDAGDHVVAAAVDVAGEPVFGVVGQLQSLVEAVDLEDRCDGA